MAENNIVPINTPPPPQLVIEALKAGASVEVLNSMMTAQERWDAINAKKAFNAAFAAFKANPPAILKDTEVTFGSGKTSYKHEDLAKLMGAVDPALAAHGLWAAFKMKTLDDGKVWVACIIGHSDGHTEERCELAAMPDTSGNKNPAQAIGSITAYLQRYTLKGALGVAAAKDDDARSSAPPSGVITDRQAEEINGLLLKHFGPKAVETFLKAADAMSVSDIMATKYDSCMRYLNRQIAAQDSKAKK